ncbi:MAG: hypothetical protein HPZ91_08115 [Lentisphaeria bacterium]|nr:hypothetical protein [Lentisphaeria bacterium]
MNLKRLPFLAAAMCLPAAFASPVPEAPGGLFFPDEPLAFKAAPADAGSWRLHDAENRVIRNLECPGKAFRLEPCGRGYYELVRTNADGKSERVSFSVVPRPASAPKPELNPFALDIGMSTSFRPEPVRRGHLSPETAAELAYRAGVTIQRDRSGDGRPFPWLSGRKAAAELSRSRGIEPVGMLEGLHFSVLGAAVPGEPAPPQRRHADPGDTRYRNPPDLRQVYKHCREYAAELGGSMRYAEYGNEPDCKTDTVWDMAAATKAGYLGLKAGSPEMTVLSPSFSQGDPEYVKEFFRNGCGDYFDIFNFHAYRYPADYEAFAGMYLAALDRIGGAGRAVFVTENGDISAAGCPSGGADPADGTLRRQSPEQERIQAEFAVKSNLRMIALGVTANFLFYLPAYAGEHYALTRPDGSAKPALTVLANLSRLLGSAEYLGEYGAGTGMRAMLFALPDKTQVLAVWKAGFMDLYRGRFQSYALPVPERKAIPFPGRGGRFPVSDMYGRSLPDAVAAGGKLNAELSELPIFITRLSGLKPASPAPAPRNRFRAPERPELDKTVVVRMVPESGLSPSMSGTYALLTAPEARLRLEVYNFDDAEKRGTLTLSGAKLPAGFDLALAPQERRVLYATVRPERGGNGWTRLRVSGSFGGKHISAAEIPAFRLDTEESAWRPLPGGPAPAPEPPFETRLHSPAGTVFTAENPENCYRRYYGKRIFVPLRPDLFRRARAIRFRLQHTEGRAEQRELRLVVAGKDRNGRPRRETFAVPPCTGNEPSLVTVVFPEDMEPFVHVDELQMATRYPDEKFTVGPIEIPAPVPEKK